MVHYRLLNPKRVVPVLLLVALIIAVACGGEEATPTPAPRPTATPAPTPTSAPQPTATLAPAVLIPTPVPAVATATSRPAPTATPVPVATPTPTPTPPAKVKPTGSLGIAYNEIGTPQLLPKNTGYPQASYNNTAIYETGWRGGPKGELEPWLIREWSNSPDFLTWTLRLQKGVQFHKGWGEFTAQDLKWNIENALAEGSIHPGIPNLRSAFQLDKGGYIKVVDDYTLEVYTGTRKAFDLPWALWSWGDLIGVSATSKKYYEAVGEQKATIEGIGTSPWEFAEFRSGDVFRMKAVENHWRKTPNFAELVFREIPEVSTRVASFQTGQVDSMHMNAESLPVIEKVPGVKFLRFPGAFMVWLNIHGNNYIDREGVPKRDTSLPWVSASADTSSPEWERARKVREAMSIAIDRQSIVDALLLGEGRPISHLFWHGHDARLGYLKDLKYEYDLERAKKLLAEVGQANGFDIDIALTLMPTPGVREAGQAACVMWEKINVRCKQTQIPMTAFRPNFVNRSWKGLNTHGASTIIEPLYAYTNVVNSKGLINYGMEHPKLDELLARVSATFDTEERWERQRELAKWMFENVTLMPLVEGNFIYPLGPKIDVWPLQCCFYGHLNNLEDVPHRK